jgi:hypothetical protein
MSRVTTQHRGDLQAVTGIGRSAQQRLNDRGITTLAQLSERSPAELAAMLEGMKGGFSEARIRTERWPEQAAALLAAGPASDRDARRVAKPTIESVRHNFMVEAQLDAVTGTVIAAQADHVQSHDKMTWTHWEPSGVVAFMEERMGVASVGLAPEPTELSAVAMPSARQPSSPAALHSFAFVPGHGVHGDVTGALHARVSFHAAGLQLDPGDDTASAHVRVFLQGHPATKAVLVGEGAADVRPGAPVDVEVTCHIPDVASSSQPTTMFATVQVYAANAERPAQASLPDSRLELVPGP